MNRQSGAALIMGLLLLLVLTMLAVAAVNMSTVNLRIVGNMQASQQTEAGIQQAIEAALLDPNKTYFTTDKAAAFDVNVPNVGLVHIQPRTCLYSTFIEDQTAGVTTAEIPVWEVTATFTDPLTNATTEYVQGMRLVMEGNGNCL